MYPGVAHKIPIPMSDYVLLFILFSGLLILNKETLLQDLSKWNKGEE